MIYGRHIALYVGLCGLAIASIYLPINLPLRFVWNWIQDFDLEGLLLPTLGHSRGMGGSANLSDMMTGLFSEPLNIARVAFEIGLMRVAWVTLMKVVFRK